MGGRTQLEYTKAVHSARLMVSRPVHNWENARWSIDANRLCLCSDGSGQDSGRAFRSLRWGKRTMTEAEFLTRFERQATGVWSCTKPIKIDGPNGPLFIMPGQSFSPGALFLGIDLAKELDRMAAIQRAASRLSGEGFANAA
jgi:hypothetical protein